MTIHTDGRFYFHLELVEDLNPKWACTVKKNSPGDCFLGARCEDGYQNPQDFGRQAVQIRQKADLRPSAPASSSRTTQVCDDFKYKMSPDLTVAPPLPKISDFGDPI